MYPNANNLVLLLLQMPPTVGCYAPYLSDVGVLPGTLGGGSVVVRDELSC